MIFIYSSSCIWRRKQTSHWRFHSNLTHMTSRLSICGDYMAGRAAWIPTLITKYEQERRMVMLACRKEVKFSSPHASVDGWPAALSYICHCITGCELFLMIAASCWGAGSGSIDIQKVWKINQPVLFSDNWRLMTLRKYSPSESVQSWLRAPYHVQLLCCRYEHAARTEAIDVK